MKDEIGFSTDEFVKEHIPPNERRTTLRKPDVRYTASKHITNRPPVLTFSLSPQPDPDGFQRMRLDPIHSNHPIFNLQRGDLFTLWDGDELIDGSVHRFKSYWKDSILTTEYANGDTNGDTINLRNLNVGNFRLITPTFYNKTSDTFQMSHAVRLENERKSREEANHARYLGRNLRNEI